MSPAVRITGLVLGFALAIAATLAVFLTENALYLRLAVIAVAWAFVIAAFSAGRRRTDQAVAAGREAELRQAYALELEREVAARREYELKLENQLRREAQEAMRAELDGLRADLASLAGLRESLLELGELRSDMGRLRRELTEQLDGEMLVERIVMRTQSIRMPAERPELGGRTIDALGEWEDRPAAAEGVSRVQPPPVPAPAVRADEPGPPGPLPVGPPPVEPPSVEPPSVEPPVQAPPAAGPSRHASPGRDDRVATGPTAARHSTAEQVRVVLPPAGPPAPPAPRPDPVPRAQAVPEVPPRPVPVAGPPSGLWDTPTDSAPTGTEPARPHRRAAPEEPPPAPAQPEHEPDVFETAGHQRLTEILAESGTTLGGRRRRRYREDDGDGDDVLARVLGE
ncbi:hypothetical protein SAMN05661030_1974 [Klenkia taihuensis]|uniref:DUF6779 domain-containing protein n=1 Tax=Klenkia taihuensis TaxID=1225127 RepID=A0A1I1N5N9_9ACTN|nr:hypothetical protein SAMN05661030_1974 [Klenkia taihuensis]